MGHSEMLLAVAGLTEDETIERTRRLAEGEWEGFTPAERVALRFARKLTKEPAAVTAADFEELAGVHGRDGALDILWHVSWGNYMTRIADVFQLPLERTNVFAAQRPPK